MMGYTVTTQREHSMAVNRILNHVIRTVRRLCAVRCCHCDRGATNGSDGL